MFTASEILRTKIALVEARLGAAAYDFWMHPQFPAVYHEYLLQSHAIIRASAPLMRAARQCCLLPRFSPDPALKLFAEYLERHAEEETGHDEWILNDAEAMGIKRRSIEKQIPGQIPAEIVGAQYYYMHHYSPLALIGYIAVLEGSPPKKEFIKSVARRNRLPLEAFTSFLYHAGFDPRHKAELDEMIDSLPLTKDQCGLIGLSAIRTIHYLTKVLDGINQSHRHVKRRRPYTINDDRSLASRLRA